LELQAEGKIIAMTGDGVNDSVSLSTANIGVAMGNGADIAIESADIVLIKNDPNGVQNALTLSKKTMKNIKQNLFWAIIYNVVGIPIAISGLLNPVFSAGAMSFSSISVLLNALRLNLAKIKAPTKNAC
jgi:Cu+-exporting ATPase